MADARVTQAGTYVETRSNHARVTQAGAYVEMQQLQAFVTQMGAYVEVLYVPVVSGPTLAQRLRHGMGLVNGVVYGAGSV